MFIIETLEIITEFLDRWYVIYLYELLVKLLFIARLREFLFLSSDVIREQLTFVIVRGISIF